ncbi:MAG: CotH kinase family protein [Polyangiaceae bacterium]
MQGYARFRRSPSSPSSRTSSSQAKAFTSTRATTARSGSDGARFELLNPDGSPGFQANTGIRIRGGYSRRAQNPKHAFRLFFRGEHGTKKLTYALFGSEGASEFDKIDLRTAQNYSWSGDSGTGEQMTMTRDVFSRDLQGALGRPYTRSRAYHLYLDGVYWGIYQTEERPEARYAETYFGGDTSDYDVIKPERSDSTGEVIATDGTLDTWNALWSLSQAGFADDAAFYRIEGKDASGRRDASLPVYVDVDNLVDYMLVIYFTANFDGPASKWFKNNQANNFYAIRNHVSVDRGFVFLTHDSEHSLHARPITITSGVDENRVSIGEAGGATDGNGRPSEAYRMTVSDVRQFNPQWLHFRLTENARYRERFARRAHELLEAGGAFSRDKMVEVHRRRVDEIDQAIVVESARWGDAQSPSRPRTKREHFEPAVQLVEGEFLTKRGAILIEQLREAGLY